MIPFTVKLHDEMQAGLQQVALENDNLLQRAEKSFYLVGTLLAKLKDFMLNHTFKDTAEEIRFFKEIKPAFLKELIYWSEIIHIETSKPVGSKRKSKRYFMQIMDAMNLYFHRNRQLYTYYMLRRTEDDERYFTRETSSTHLTPEYNLDLDTSFSTVNSTRLARIMAFEEVAQFLVNSIKELDGGKAVTEDTGNKQRLIWTGTKAQFIEFCYGVQCVGVLNNGKANIREVVEHFGHFLNIKVTHYYTYFQSMRIRKKDRTPFLKWQIEKTERRMDESDEFPRFQ